MTLRINQQAIFHYILMFLLISFQGSAYYKVSENIFLIVGYVVSIYAICRRENNVSPLYILNGVCGGFYILIIFSLLIASISNGGSLSILSIGNVFVRLLLAYATLIYNEEMFIHRYVKLVYFLSGVSLVGYVLQIVFPNILLTLFPRVNYGRIYGFLFFMYTPNNPSRNIGMFTEPGLFAIILCVAIFLLMFHGNKYFESELKKNICLLVIIITLITAQSTTGYVALIIILICRLVGIDVGTGMRRSLKWVLAFAGVFVCVDLLRGSESIIQSAFLSKLFSDQGTLDLSASNSGNARVISALADIQVVLRYPLGAGYEIYDRIWPTLLSEQIWDTSSCAGLTKSLAIYGIPAIASFFAMLLYYLNKFHGSIVEKICCIALFAVMTMSQPTVFYPAFICMFMIGGGFNSEDNLEEAEVMNHDNN